MPPVHLHHQSDSREQSARECKNTLCTPDQATLQQLSCSSTTNQCHQKYLLSYETEIRNTNNFNEKMVFRCSRYQTSIYATISSFRINQKQLKLIVTMRITGIFSLSLPKPYGIWWRYTCPTLEHGTHSMLPPHCQICVTQPKHDTQLLQTNEHWIHIYWNHSIIKPAHLAHKITNTTVVMAKLGEGVIGLPPKSDWCMGHASPLQKN